MKNRPKQRYKAPGRPISGIDTKKLQGIRLRTASKEFILEKYGSLQKWVDKCAMATQFYGFDPGDFIGEIEVKRLKKSLNNLIDLKNEDDFSDFL